MPITNTKSNRNPLLEGVPGSSIEAMEASGQCELCAASQLPAAGISEFEPQLVAAGGKVVGPSAGDSLFVDVKIPDGWTIQPTAHSMWSDLLDSDGKAVAAIFYKAAFYDRKARISPVTE